MKFKVLKMGNKLGIYFPKSYSSFNKGELVEIKIIKENKEEMFLTKFNRNVVIRKPTSEYLNLCPEEVIDIEFKKINEIEKSKEIFKDNKIDLLALIPESTSNGYKIFVNNFIKNNEDWLRAWYCHERGSGKQLEIRRFIDIDLFGRLLGQLQAEGTKSGKRFKLEFCNQLIKEHVDYISYLEKLGIPRNLIICKCDFHPDVKDIINEKIKNFEVQTEMPVSYIVNSEGGKGSYGFKTFVRNTLITEIILNSLSTIRKKLTEETFNNNYQDLTNAFFAKLLTGDGTLDITTKNRKYNFPEARIKITDCNLKYLKDYATIMKRLGFNPHISEKHISVRSYIGFDKLLYLYKIKAFYNTINWKKLIFLINENLKGRRLKTLIRFLDFIKSNEIITSKNLAEKYDIKIRTANNWLNKKEKEGFLVRTDNSRPVKWVLAEKAKELANLLDSYKQELTNLNIDTTKDISQFYLKNNKKLRK